jgi:hypothetical protein
MDEILKRDGNYVTVLGGVTDDANQLVRMLRVDPTTGRVLVSATGSSSTVDWGDIEGTLSNQTDLQTALNGKISAGAITSSGLTMATNRVLGRTTASPGAVEELTGNATRDLIGVGTGDSPQFAGINVGHATDTTITRLGAGRIAVESIEVLTLSNSAALTNKTGNISMWTNDSGYITATSTNTLTNKSGNISQWTNDSGYITATSTNTLTGKSISGATNTLSAIPVSALASGTDGELITWDASGNPATVPVGTAGQVLTSNGAGAAPTFQDAAGGGINPSSSVVLYDDFVLGTDGSGNIGFGWTSNMFTSGSIAIGQPGGATTNNHPGIINIATGSSTNEGIRIYSNPVSITEANNQVLKFAFRLDSVTTSSRFNLGIIPYGNRSSLFPSAFIGIEYDTFVNSTIRGKCISGASSFTSTGITASTGLWCECIITISSTSVNFNINGTDLGNITTNIPAASQEACIMAEALCLDNAVRTMLLDYVYYEKTGITRY